LGGGGGRGIGDGRVGFVRGGLLLGFVGLVVNLL
jgi:hypothetical protein